MTFPPLVASVRIGSFPLWIPIVLVWMPLLLLLAPLLLLALLVALAAAPRWSFLALAGGLWIAFCELRGTSLELQGNRRRVSIALY